MGQLVLSSGGGLGHGCCQGCRCGPPRLCGCFPAAAGFSNHQKSVNCYHNYFENGFILFFNLCACVFCSSLLCRPCPRALLLLRTLSSGKESDSLQTR